MEIKQADKVGGHYNVGGVTIMAQMDDNIVH